MGPVYELNGLRVIDLTRHLDPATEGRRCHLRRFHTGGPIPDYHTDMDLTSHLGTHVECPYHHHDGWTDVEGLPLTAYMGRALYVNLDVTAPLAHITGGDLDRACGARIRAGDIVILDSPYKLPPFTPATNGPEDRRLLIGAESAAWLRAKGVKCVGFGDGVSIENRNEDVKPFHDILMAENITFLEVLCNLEYLETDVFFLSYAPIPIKGLDSCPIRAYAIEGLGAFG